MSGDGRLFAFAAATLPRSVVVVDLPTGSRDTVSRTTDGAPANGDSYDAALSADGRYVAFTSYASNLVSGDTNGRADVFVHDRRTGRTERVIVSSGELEANDDSFGPQISADGRYVAFGSRASNLVEGDQNGRTDLLVRDRQLGTTGLVSVRGQAPRAGSVRLRPRGPRAGRPLAATIAVTHAGRPLLTATIRCAATVAGRRLAPVSVGFARGTGRCAWRVPPNSRTKLLRGTVTAVTTTGTVTRSFAQPIR